MPKKIQDFALSALVRPVVVNVGRAGAANLDVVQQVEYVKQEAKIVYLLECLQKTPPPVLIFAENKHDVDDIYEYLLLKGVETVAIHGGKSKYLLAPPLSPGGVMGGHGDTLLAFFFVSCKILTLLSSPPPITSSPLPRSGGT